MDEWSLARVWALARVDSECRAVVVPADWWAKAQRGVELECQARVERECQARVEMA